MKVTFSLTTLLLGALRATPTFSQETQTMATINPTCPLDCQGEGAFCARGNADFSKYQSTNHSLPFLKDLNQGGYHCDCPIGRTGVLCERTYETCSDGFHFCFHGGRCMTGIKDAHGNEQHYCDCGEAEHDGQPYAGKYCEAEAVEVCGEAAEYGKVFCTNGGTCRDSFLEHLDQPCVCEVGFEGPHCEYRSAAGVPDCELDCQNGGKCQIGDKNYPPNQLYKEFWKTHDDNRYCTCPPGFFGLYCEIEGEKCGDEHCFNGGTCVTKQNPDGTTRNYCDCTTAHNQDKSYAGRYCEAESTAFCTKMADHNGHQFCVNGGNKQIFVLLHQSA